MNVIHDGQKLKPWDVSGSHIGTSEFWGVRRWFSAGGEDEQCSWLQSTVTAAMLAGSSGRHPGSLLGSGHPNLHYSDVMVTISSQGGQTFPWRNASVLFGSWNHRELRGGGHHHGDMSTSCSQRGQDQRLCTQCVRQTCCCRDRQRAATSK